MTGFFEKVRLFFSERFRDINRQLLYAAIVLILYGIKRLSHIYSPLAIADVVFYSENVANLTGA